METLETNLLIIKLMLTQSWGYNKDVDMFYSGSYYLYCANNKLDELEAIAKHIGKINCSHSIPTK